MSLKDGKLGTFRHLRLPKDYDKTVSREYFLNQGGTNDMSSLTWFDGSNIVANEDPYDWACRPLKLVPVHIYSSGLIFKDIMFATGMTLPDTAYGSD